MNNKKYDVYSEFDINKHAKYFIDYLEVAIAPNGKVFYAVPSHTIFLENLLIKKWGHDKFKKEIECDEAYNNWLKWLCSQTGYILVWNNFYVAGDMGLTKRQKEKLIKLKNTLQEKIKIPIYQGEIEYV